MNRAVRIAISAALTVASVAVGLTGWHPASASVRPHPIVKAFPTPRPLDCGTWGCFPTFPNPSGSGWEEMLVESNVTSTLCLDGVGLTAGTALKAKACNGGLSQDWWVKLGSAGSIQLQIWNPNTATWMFAGFDSGAFRVLSSGSLYRWSDTGAIKILMDSTRTYWMNTPPSAGQVIADPNNVDNGWIFSSLCFTDADCTT